MSNIVKLLVISFFLVGCKSGYTQDAKKTRNADSEITRNVTNHINDVSGHVANNASLIPR